jgi:hypothetical protein
MTPLPFAAAAALGVLLLSAPALAQGRGSEPIPGVDIIVEKNPGGTSLVVGQSGPDGWFRGPVRVEAGEYEVGAACPPRRQCPAFRLTSVRINGRMIAPNGRGQFVFPVGSSVGTQVRLEARVLAQPTSTAN